MPGSDFGVARVALETDIAALEMSVDLRKPAVRSEVKAYLTGARKLLDVGQVGSSQDGGERLNCARALFTRGANVYYGSVRQSNRYIFVVGVLCSALAVSLVLPVATYLSARVLTFAMAGNGHNTRVFESLDLPVLMVLFGFAGLGSAVSVLSRLDKIVVPQVFRKTLVFFSGAGRPLVAAACATVAYALAQAGLIGRELLLGSHRMHPDSIVTWWCVVIAFLCGYSERFASDILGKTLLASGEMESAAGLRFSRHAGDTRPAGHPGRHGG